MSATPDALDQVKLDKQKLDLKFKQLILSGALKKFAITGYRGNVPFKATGRVTLQLDSGRVFGAEEKKNLEIVLLKAEADQNMEHSAIVPDGR